MVDKTFIHILMEYVGLKNPMALFLGTYQIEEWSVQLGATSNPNLPWKDWIGRVYFLADLAKEDKIIV